MIKIIIFGIGRHLKKKINDISTNAEIVAFSDNNSDLWGQEYLGEIIISPSDISEQDFDFVVISTSKYYSEIRRQLLDLGICHRQICYFDIINAILKRGQITFYGADDNAFSTDALLINDHLNYDGGTMACVYAAQALKDNYKKVCIAVPCADMRLVKEINAKGIVVAIAPALFAPGKVELDLAKYAQFVLVNIYLSIAAAYEFSRIRPVMWWIHENSERINETNEWYFNNQNTPVFNGIRTIAVCNNVRENLKKVWPELPVEIMNYGLPDFYEPVSQKRSEKQSVVFAVIGGMIHRKAQDLFVKAALKYNEICKVSAEFWMIGGSQDLKYFNIVMEIAKDAPNIIWKGEMSRDELENTYPQIDVLVCPSRQEGLPIVVNEGLMNAKVCIVADTAGDNDYIIDGVNGMFFRGEDVGELAKKMKYAAENYNGLQDMRMKARRVYLDHYSLDSFKKRLYREIGLTIRDWRPNSSQSISYCQDLID